MRQRFPEDFENLVAIAREFPPLHAESSKVRRFAFHRESKTIYLYRIPIKYLGRAFDPVEEIMRVESYVIEAAAEMVGKDPRDFLDPRD